MSKTRLEIFMNENKPTSTKAIAEQCRRVGIPCPPFKSHPGGEEAYQEWEATYGPRHPWIAALASWRSINKLYQTFLTMKERLRPDGTMPFALKYFGAHCFTGDHEVLTRLGWVKLDKWNGGEIMQWAGGKLNFAEAVPNKFLVQSGERLLQLKTGQINCVVTQGHWMATFDCKTGEQRKEQAGHIKTQRRKIPVSAPYIGGTEELPAWKIQLIAAVQADGHYLTDCRSIRFRLTRARKIERLRGILAQSGLDYKEAIYPSEPTVTVITLRQFPEWLGNRKLWGSELLTWSLKCLCLLRDELVHWDGTKCGPNSICYVTTKKQNADWISTIVHLTGYAASVTKREGQQENWSTAYSVFIRPADKISVSKKNWSDFGPALEVFCPTAKYGACLFRHNDTIFITYQTGRWSGDARINMQNMRKKPVLSDERGIMITDEKTVDAALEEHKATGDFPETVRHVIDFRKLIIPRPGKKMILSDLAQIEPRCLAWLAGDTAKLDLVKSGMSLYEAHARINMGYAGEKLPKDDPTYALAKAQVLALGYQAGWEKFIVMAYDYTGQDFTEGDPEWIEVRNPVTGEVERVSGYGSTAKKIVETYRKENPKIIGIWNQLDLAFKQSIGSKFEIGLPGGRKLRYDAVKCGVRIVVDSKTKQPRRKTVFTADVAGRRVETYGGKLTENLVQAVAREIFAYGLLKLADARIDVLFTSHDEAICEVDNSVSVRDIEGLMSVTPEYMPGLPVAAEAKEVKHYEK